VFVALHLKLNILLQIRVRRLRRRQITRIECLGDFVDAADQTAPARRLRERSLDLKRLLQGRERCSRSRKIAGLKGLPQVLEVD